MALDDMSVMSSKFPSRRLVPKTLKSDKMSFDEIIENLLFLENDTGGLSESVKAFYELLCNHSEIGDVSYVEADSEEIILTNGKAISPKDAATCVLDIARTSKFIRGIYAAIIKAKTDFPGEKIEILYAGCGPFAALAIPQCAKFGSDEISFTLIEIHPRSIESATTVFENLGFRDHVCKFILTDASTNTDFAGKKFHIIVSETMQKSLEKEPQAAIMLNLAKHLIKSGIFIPQKITISAVLSKLAKEFSGEDRQRVELGTVFELSAKNTDIFSTKIVEIPQENFDGMAFLLLTEIKIFGNIFLGDYQSGITYPTILFDIPKGSCEQKIEFKYEFGETPGVRHKIL